MTTNHVVSLELSIALRDAGYPQEGSTFYYHVLRDGVGYWLTTEPKVSPEYMGEVNGVVIAAPLASELGEVLPASIDGFETYAGLSIEKTDGNFWTVAYENFAYKVHMEKSSHSLADAMAFMLIHLLENKLITL